MGSNFLCNFVAKLSNLTNNMKTNSITKRMYTAPKMRVYKLHGRTHLLQMSGRKNYDPDDDNPFAPNP